ncbi:MAG: amidohydrolase [Proteobacteria bacterium]|nr:amidohydrolase [Pseudomonadota bacterium]
MPTTPTATAHAWIDAHAAAWSDWHQTIWDYAEPAWREYRSAEWFVAKLREHGFRVEAGSGGMPTAFAAEWSNGAGPSVAAYAEYDAVPGNCQAASTRCEPRPGLSPHAAGHTDPHSALGIGALVALLATQAAMKSAGIAGTLRFFGEPAEKVQGSKLVHGLRGYYDGLDAIVSYHPFYMLPLCNTVRWDTHCGAYGSRIYSFVCDAPETWPQAASDSPIAAAHSAARAPGANVSLATMFLLTKSTTESMLAHTGGWSLNEAILTAGQATADNLPAQLAQVNYAWRAPTLAMADAILDVLDRNAEHAAAVGHCRLVKRWVSRTRPGVANHALAEVTYRNLAGVGAPRYGAQAIALAREIQANLGLEPMAAPFLPACEALIEPREAEARLREQMPAWQTNWTSDDYVEMTWYAPTVRLYIARPMLAVPPGYAGYPAWVSNALGGLRPCIDPTIAVAGKTIAGTLLELLTTPAALRRARAEFEERTGGARFVPPQLPRDFAPPIDYRWPEYVTTARGREWWIPATPELDRRTSV